MALGGCTEVLVATPGRLRDHFEATAHFQTLFDGLELLVLDEVLETLSFQTCSSKMRREHFTTTPRTNLRIFQGLMEK